jgi:hypothetical protein
MAVRRVAPLPTLVEHIPTETVTFDLGTTPPPAQYRIFVDLPGPLSPASNTSPFLVNMLFTVLTPGCSVVGYSYWCCKSGQDTTPVRFALFRLVGPTAGTLIPAGTVTGPTMITGAWNDALLPAPVPLSVGPAYVAQAGLTNAFPFTPGYWGTGGVGYDGMTNGPLMAYSAPGASNPTPFSQPQAGFGTGSSDPTVGVASTPASDANGWVDVLISTG